MDVYFITSTDGKEYGPTDLTGLSQWVREGRVLAATPVRKNDQPPVPASTLPELAPAFGPPPPNPVPPMATSVQLPREFLVWEFIGRAWDIMKPYWLPLAGMSLIMTAIGAVPYLGACVMFIIGGALYVGFYRAILGLLAGKPPTVGMLFESFDRFGPAFLAWLVTGVLICIGSVLCIVPGVILFLMWMFTYLVLAESQLDFWPAMQESARLTAGYRWPLFGLALALLLVNIAGLLLCFVGTFVAQPLSLIAVALAYRFLQQRKGQQTA